MPKKTNSVSNSKILKCIVSSLEEGRFKHVLRWKNRANKEFSVLFVHKSNPKWHPSCLDLFRALDGLSKKKYKAYLEKPNYESACKVRCRSNLNKLCNEGVLSLCGKKNENKSKCFMWYKINDSSGIHLSLLKEQKKEPSDEDLTSVLEGDNWEPADGLDHENVQSDFQMENDVLFEEVENDVVFKLENYVCEENTLCKKMKEINEGSFENSGCVNFLWDPNVPDFYSADVTNTEQPLVQMEANDNDSIAIYETTNFLLHSQDPVMCGPSAMNVEQPLEQEPINNFNTNLNESANFMLLPNNPVNYGRDVINDEQAFEILRVIGENNFKSQEESADHVLYSNAPTGLDQHATNKSSWMPLKKLSSNVNGRDPYQLDADEHSCDLKNLMQEINAGVEDFPTSCLNVCHNVDVYQLTPVAKRAKFK